MAHDWGGRNTPLHGFVYTLPWRLSAECPSGPHALHHTFPGTSARLLRTPVSSVVVSADQATHLFLLQARQPGACLLLLLLLLDLPLSRLKSFHTPACGHSPPSPSALCVARPFSGEDPPGMFAD